MTRPLIHVVKWLLIAQLSYLLLVNAALQLQLTQDLINLIRPEKFQVSWQDAHSWYPFRAEVKGLSASGQTRSQQWQLKASQASGSISLLALIGKEVRLHDVQSLDID